MNDFKKGLLIGALIIIGCVSFMANTSDENSSKNRYILHQAKIEDYSNSFFMIDSWTGKLFQIPANLSMQLDYEVGKKPQWIQWLEVDKNDYEKSVKVQK